MEARGRVKELFKGQADLLLVFDEFLPVPPSTQKNLYDLADENLEKGSPRIPLTSSTVEKGAACVVHHIDHPKARNFPKNGGGSSNIAADCGAVASEKRKMYDRSAESNCHRESSGAFNKRRLISISKLQNTVKRCIDGQSKDSWLEPPQSIRKFRRPERLSPESIKPDQAYGR